MQCLTLEQQVNEMKQEIEVLLREKAQMYDEFEQ